MLIEQVWSVLLFLACIAVLPFLIKRWKGLQGGRAGDVAESAPRIVSVLAVGPQQRVVTIEVGQEGSRIRMILGVTPQNICCLSSEPLSAPTPVAKTDTIGASATIVG